MTTLELACGGDLGYLPHTAAMVHSVLAHRGALDVHVHYLHDPAVGDDDGRAFAAMIEREGGRATLVAVEPGRLTGLPTIHHLTAATWYRVFMPELLPDVERVLYLDGDTIVMDDLGPLWATDLGGATVAAVTNVFEPWNSGWPTELPITKPYFNAGVVIFDLERMRSMGATRRILDFALTRDEWPFGDQDSVNAVLADERRELHPRWNVQNSVMHFDEAFDVLDPGQVREARENPGIRHWEGPGRNKPWNYMTPRAHREAYLRHRRRTPWRRVELEERTPVNMVRRRLRPLRQGFTRMRAE